uniref:Mitochondrial import inner membrane translocase subunit n=1 Tax=Cacopsylla melanoneura TaxID=428564 RepID=A0A8D8RMX6_9HEMI
MSLMDSGLNFNEGSISASGMTTNNNKDLEDFLMLEREKAKMTAQMFEFTDICWDKCMTDKPSTRLESKTETCIVNCVDRFIDISMFIANRLTQKSQGLSGLDGLD